MTSSATSSRVAGVLLAAGESRRFIAAVPKQLALFQGVPMVRRAALQALGARLEEVVAVIGHQADAVGDALADLPLRVLFNPDYREGRSGSVRTAVEAVGERCRAALFLPVDQPLLSAGDLDRLVEAYEESGAGIVVPTWKGRRSAPVLFDRSYFGELTRLGGDEGGRVLLLRHPHEIRTVPFASPDPLTDVDTIEDLKRLEFRLTRTGSGEGPPRP